ncbi:MAG: Transposase IS116/IS110/IS902 family protein [Actinobacteria bacterium ADurb.Bin444]|nr:MAG: Transposase IS116/IS110/IS902 family protein [Actinobacteria bacterium ADurb.Bin444]
MKRKAYRATAVKQVCWEVLNRGREGCPLQVGFDVGKHEVLAVVRWEDSTFERPWLVKNPGEIGILMELLRSMACGRSLRLAMEPTGTYGDVLRQALSDAHLPLERVGAKAAHDYAEIFDGVPSQHDGKDAAVVAELSALGKSSPWVYEEPSETEREMAYWVDWMDAQQRQYVMWLGRLEALVSRHWPEAREWLKLSSGVLLRVLHEYGGPAKLCGDGQAAQRLACWGRRYLQAAKIRGLLESARQSLGVRQSPSDVRRVQQYAAQALAARREIGRSKRRLEKLARGNAVIERQARAVGLATACVLWVYLGDPSRYHCGEAYRKAMGLNLKERSSGMYQGTLRISKRGFGQVRRWLYFAALRLIVEGPVGRWYQRKKAKDGEKAQRAVIGVMRKLALALHAVGARGEEFCSRRLFPGKHLAVRRRGGKRTFCRS